ncbi:transcriptional regulator, TetR family protein [Oceanicola granulosus HTCC2516]|uniref:Transcriptional regulator, TetR family protein n=1 Tax=Oceanicola granulosus (strain ATCC BAA-861 / DSM 15982 / KCTC 12143 / HTCC2516) TaxID=314256 RepID=Q2CCV4_OCEGH|nr:TetR/AcrR family transcriptional regulator [Oceanicola granulosus]EAR50519.1 transcriptional regulator, TetR family protein [Oceanicola granulosus HTCC2516]
MPDGSGGEIKKGRKFEQVLEGARRIFMADGYEGASVDDIARAAKVSKATLYSYFPDKRLLFLEVAKGECARQADLATATIDQCRPVREVLTEAGMTLVRFVTSAFARGIFRLCVAEAERFPQLGREFYQSGPAMGRARFVEYFESAIERGELKIDDVELAAEQFQELCKADLFQRMIFCNTHDFTDAEIERVVTGAVDVFLARYGA